MTTPDIVMLIVTLVSALIGLTRGLLRELLSLATWFAAFILALYFAPEGADLLLGQVAEHKVRLVLGFGGIFLATLIVGGLIQWFVYRSVGTSGLSHTDRVLGLLFGGARGVLLCLIMLIALRPFAEDASWRRTSMFAPELLAFEQDVLKFMGRAKDMVIEITDEA